MSSSLIIVESPAKARTISRFFDRDFKVLASMGHVRDLPERSLGIDIKQGFRPNYVLTGGGRKVIGRLRPEVASAKEIYLATDPDREGEAIAWHLQQALAPHTKASFHRVTFHEITDEAVRRAFAGQHQIDSHKVDAQQARRILDRIVGYKVSPLLWKRVERGTSAGRVQSVALRLVCEREREILGFISEEYWNLNAHFSPLDREAAFCAPLFKLDGRKPQIPNQQEANRLATEIEAQSSTGGQSFFVSDRQVKDKQQRPAPPFITSSLQQLAGARLRMTTRQTMAVAQQLYEGLEMGESGSTGLITYMRTDSFAVAREAQAKARDYIKQEYGAEFVPAKPNVYRARRGAQEAHEAIRPTDVERTPEAMAGYLSPPQLKLYRLIWQRFVASQMAPAKLRQTSLEVKPKATDLTHDYLFRTTVTETIFPGFMKVLADQDIDADQTSAKEKNAPVMPDLRKGDPCRLLKLEREQAFTQPPKRFSEATLVRELERNGVGRPSTYAATVNTIQERKYVERDKGRLIPTKLGFEVNDYLVARLDRIFKVDFTAKMEGELDAIEEGRENMNQMLERFYRDFIASVKEAEQLDAPATDKVRRIIEMFPSDLAWRPPAQVGRKTYDDVKFFESLKKQVEDGQKPLSDRQWRALLALAASYEEQIPQLWQVTEELGVADEVRQLVERRRQRREQQEQRGEQEESAVEDLLQAMEKVQWQPPRQSGGRVYDDQKFFQSLKKQKESGRKLTPAQVRALGQLALRYRQQIEDCDRLLARNNLHDLEENGGAKEKMSESDKKAVGELLAMADQIEQWQPARKVRGRTYDDREFINSLRDQFQRQGHLTARQINALRKTIGRYRQQLPESR